MAGDKEIIGLLPIKIDLKGTRGDDLTFTFNPFTIGGKAFDAGSTVRMYGVDKKDNANIFNVSGTFDPDALGTDAGRKKVVFVVPRTDNDVVTEWTYDIEVTYPSGNIHTQVIGTLKISGS